MSFCLTKYKNALLFSVTALLSMAVLGVAERVRADDKPYTAVMRPSVSRHDQLQPLSAAIERVLRTKLDHLNVVRVSGSPYVEMDDLQLAVGCLNETMECYKSVAESLSVDAFIVPNLDKAEPETLVTLRYIDTRDPGQVKRVLRRFPADKSESDIIDELEPMLRELFGMPQLEAKPSEPEQTPEAQTLAPEPAQSDPEDSGFPVVPVAVGALGLGLLAGGVVLGLMASSNEDKYASASTTTAQEVDAALDAKSSAETQGTVSTVLLIGGAATLATAVLLYFLLDDAETETPPKLALRPELGLSALGLSLTGVIDP